MSNSEILGLHRITKKHLRDLCKKHKLYQTPDLNDQLYLHFQGFQSIENLEEYTALKCLWLESNAISEIQGLDCQTKLKCLFLQNNLIKKIENLQCCTSLDTLNLSSNHITKIENCGIEILPELSTLNLSRNYLQNSDAIRELVKCKQLWSLDLSNNRIDDILVVKIFAQMPELRVLVLQGNPVVSKVPQYRKTLILECKNLTYLDSRPVFPKDRACAEAWKRGGYEEERKEHDRWIRMDRKKTRDSVNATLRLRQKHGAGDIQLLESSDDENDKNDQNKLKQIPEDGTSTGDLEIIGVIEKVSKDSSESSDSSSSNSSEEEKKHGSDKEIDHELLKNNNNNEFEEQLMFEENLTKGLSCPKIIVENVNGEVLNEEYKNEEETCKDIKRERSEIVFKISEYEKTGNKEENAEKFYENCYLELEDNKLKCEHQEILQKINKDSDSSFLSLSTSDNSEQNESITKSLSSSSSSDSSFENYSSSDNKNCSSGFEIEEVAVFKSEGLGILQEPMETNKEIDSSFLSSETSESSEQNEGTKSFSSSYSSDNGNYSFELEKEVVIRSENQEILQESIETNKNKDFPLLSLSTKNLPSSSSPSSPFIKKLSSDVSELNKCIEVLKETFLNEEYKLEEACDDVKIDEREIDFDISGLFSEVVKTEKRDENEKDLYDDSKLKLEDNIVSKNEEEDGPEKSSSLCECLNKLMSDPSNIKIEIESSKISKEEKLNHNTELPLNQNNNSASESLKILTERKMLQTNLSQPLNSTEVRIKKIFEMILTDEDSNDNLNLPAGTLGAQNKTQQLTDSKRPSNWASFEEDNTNICVVNKLDEQLGLDENSNDSIWRDRDFSLEDTIASSWLDNLLIKKDKNENSPPKKLIEEIDNNDSCLAQYDSTENTVASDWLEHHNKENDSSFLSLSTSDFSKQNESTQSFSSSSSSESSFENNSFSDSKNGSSQLQMEEDQRILQESIETNFLSASNSNFSEQNNSTKSLPSSYASISNFIINSSSDVRESKKINEIAFSEFQNTEILKENEKNRYDNSKFVQHFYGIEFNHKEFKSFNSLEGSAFLKKAIEENGDPNEIFEEPTEISEHSKYSEEGSEQIFSNLANDLNKKISENRKAQISIVVNEQVIEYEGPRKENEENLKIPQVFMKLEKNESSVQMVQKQNSTKPDLKQYFETYLQVGSNEERSLLALVSKEDEQTALFGENKETCKSSSGDNSQSPSWWERTLATARIEVSKATPKGNEDSVKDTNEGTELLKSEEAKDVFEQCNNVSEVSVLKDQGDALNFLEKILETIIDTEVDAPVIQRSHFSTEKENSNKYMQQYEEDASGSQNSANKFEDNSSSSFESSIKKASSVSTLREVVTTFNEVIENISSRNHQKSQLLKELIANPLTKTFPGQTGEQINRQVEELQQQKLEQLSNHVNIVYAQREKYDDTLDVVNGRLMVVKRSTGTLEELPPPLSQRTGSTKYISCGVSTTPTSCNDDDDDDDSDSYDFGTALSEDNDNDDEENDIEQHASDTKIKSIPTSSSDVNYCANESVSLSSAGSSTEIEKEEVDNNHHHSDVVDDSQQRVAGRLHNEIDCEVLPEFSKGLEKKEASESVSADYKLTNKGGGTQTRSEFQVELEDSFQSFMDFGENAAALEDIALIFENPEADERSLIY